MTEEVLVRVTKQVDIEASADRVWQVIGTQFYDVGAWTTSVPQSRQAPGNESRQCTVAGAPGVTHLTERLVGFDDATRSLRYEVDEGMPRFIALARNSWHIEPLGSARSRVTSTAEMTLRGGWVLLTPLMRLWVERLERTVMNELKHYVEHGEPTPAKQRQLRTAR
jgi:hypothetical protein